MKHLVTMSTELHEVVDRAVDALCLSPTVYQRDGELCRVVRAVEADGRRGVVPGTPQIRAVALPTVREELTRVADFERIRKKKSGEEVSERVLPPDSVCSAVLARGTWRGVRPLSGVIETPCLRRDLTVLSEPGYDVSSGLLFEPGIEFLPLPEHPTQLDANEALRVLCEPFADFAFTNEAARYVPVAAILTLLARPAVDGPVPIFAFDAAVRGSGKSLLANVIAMVSTGRTAPVLSWPPDEVELEKTLAACALFGARMIAIDNLRGDFAGAPLEKAVTARDKVSFRILGKTEQREILWRAVITVTANNVVFAGDMARRTLLCRIEPACERPEDRTDFQHPNLLAYIEERRPQLVAAGLTILRAFALDGRRGKGAFTWGSFEEWAALVPAAIVWAGGANVLDCRAATVSDAAEPELDALRVLLDKLPRLAPRGTTARGLLDLLWPPSQRREERPPDGYDDLRDALEALCFSKRPGEPPSSRVLGKALRRHVGRVVGGSRLVSEHDKVSNAQLWRVVSVRESGVSGSVPNPSRESESENLYQDRIGSVPGFPGSPEAA